MHLKRFFPINEVEDQENRDQEKWMALVKDHTGTSKRNWIGWNLPAFNDGGGAPERPLQVSSLSAGASAVGFEGATGKAVGRLGVSGCGGGGGGLWGMRPRRTRRAPCTGQ